MSVSLLALICHLPLLSSLLDVVEILQHKMVNVHMPKKRRNYHVSILALPQRIFLPTCLVPTLFAVDASGRDVADKDGGHAAVPHDLKLDAQPLELLIAGFFPLGASVNAGIGGEEVPELVSIPASSHLSCTHIVFKLTTASFPGITSTENHPPCEN